MPVEEKSGKPCDDPNLRNLDHSLQMMLSLKDTATIFNLSVNYLLSSSNKKEMPQNQE